MISTSVLRRGFLAFTALLSVMALTACGTSSTTTAPDSPSATSSPSKTASSSPSAAPPGNETPPPSAPPTELKDPAELEDPASLTVIVNKRRPLSPQNYAPTDLIRPELQGTAAGENAMLRAPAAQAAKQLAQAASANGTPFTLLSGYRSYTSQESTYNTWVQQNGQAQADRLSARPGYSEHQTGLTLDIGDTGGCNLQSCFAERPVGAWVAANSYRYGFVVRYQPGTEDITGYQAEPWHLRYLGVPEATAFYTSGKKTLEQFYGLPPAPNYG